MKNKDIKILIVEDDPFISDVYVLKLESEGFEVDLAEDGLVALDMIKKRDYGLILLDILMPRLDGFRVLERMKMSPTLSKIPVIILTNLSQKKDIKKGLDLGAVDFIIKTKFTPTEVVDRVTKHLIKPEAKK